MAQPFGTQYAEVYDALYEDKDYASECGLIERVFAEYSQRPVRRILDLGCGTGRHAQLLAERGYAVVGVDRSPAMIEQARRAGTSSPGVRPEYIVGDVQTFRDARRFDAALMMFAVLGYQTEEAEALAALRTARAHLHEGGLLLFDCWYGPAVIRQKPERRIKPVRWKNGLVTRTASAAHDPSTSKVTVKFDLDGDAEGQRVSGSEMHDMRYFFDADFARLLPAAGFAILRVGAMPDFDASPDATTWNVLVVARAIPQPG